MKKRTPPPPKGAARPFLEELEPRLLLSADLQQALLDAAALLQADPANAAAAQTEALEAAQAATTQPAAAIRQEIVFVDAGIDGHDQVVEALQAAQPEGRSLEIVELDAQRDGVEQITNVLAQRHDLDAVHIVAQGDEDGVRLGNTSFGSEDLDSYKSAIASWHDALAPDADLLFHGVDLAATDDGAAFVDSLAGLTGADVAAHTDLTGSALLGGYGTFETSPIVVAQRHELVFVDTQVADYQQLVDDLRSQSNGGRQLEVFLLDANRDGIEQISDALQGRHDLDAIHIFSHGVDGALELGDVWLNSFSLEARASAVAGWGTALSSDADILLYGCDVAASGDGQAFVDRLAELTGADVAASLDATGSAVLGANWVLERATGSIEAATALSTEAQGAWANVLAITVDTTSSSLTTGSTTLTFAHTINSGANRILIVNFSFQSNQGNVVSVTYGGTSLTFLGGAQASGGANTRTEMWYMKAPPVGTANVVITMDSSMKFTGGATSFFGVDQAAALTPTGGSGSGHAPTLVVASAVGEVVIDSIGDRAGNTGTVGGGQTELYRQQTGTAGGDTTGASSIEPGAPSVTMSWSFSGSGTGEWSAVATSLKPAANTAPILTLPSGPVAYTENDPATVLDAAATVSDADSANFDTGTLTVNFTAGGTANDRLEIRNQGVLAGQIGIAGSNVTWGGTIIGTFSGGTDGSTPLVVTLNANATPAAAQALVRNITFRNVSDTPSEGNRTVRFVLTDGDGGTSTAVTKTVTVTAVNDPPVNSVPGAQATTRNVAIVFSTGNGNAISISDPDAGNATVQVTLTATNGTLTLSGTTGLFFSTGDGTTDPSMVFTGTIASINTALQGMSFDPTGGYTGPASLQIVTNDLASQVVGYDTVFGTATGTAQFDKEQLATKVAFGSNGQVTSISLYLTNNKINNKVRVGLYTDVAGEPGALVVESLPTMFPIGTGWVTIDVPDTAITAGNYWIAMAPDKEGILYFNPTGGATRFSNFDPSSGLAAPWSGTYNSNTRSFSVYASFTSAAQTPLSDTDTINITVSPGSNVAPVLTPAAPSFPSITEDDVANSGSLVSTLVAGTITDGNGDPQGIAVTGLVSGNGTWQYSTNAGGSWTNVDAVTGTSALLLRSTDLLRFVPDGLNADSGSVTYRAWDQTTGTFGTKVDVSVNGGTTAFSTATDTASITVTAVNDAPSLASSAFLGFINEDTFTDSGTLVSSIVASGVSDPDTGAVKGIAITSAGTGNGTWEYTLDGSTWLSMGTPSVAAARLLPSDLTTRIRFVPNADWNGVVGLSYKAWDQTNGIAGGTADVSVSGGTTAFSSNTSATSKVVVAVNDAPTRTLASVGLAPVLEDTASPAGATVSSLFTAAFSDAKDAVPGGSSANALAGVAVMANAENTGTQGRWQWFDGGSWVDVGTSVSTSSALVLAPTTLVRFLPNANFNGTPGALTVRLIDDSSGAVTAGSTVDVTTSGGTTRYSDGTNAVTLTTSITSVNDAPAGTDKTVTTLEDTAYTFTAADFGFSDVSDSPANTLLAVTLTTLPGAGSLTNNGVAVTAGQSISLADITAGRLVFTPVANANGAGYASFTFQVQDTGGTANGGVDLDPTPNTMTVDVTSVNDAPAGADKTVTTLEDTGYTFTAADFGFSDTSDSPANTLLAVTITTLPGAGSLTNNGVAVTAGQSIVLADITAGRLVFTPAANVNGAGYASFTFQVQDTGGTANGGVDLDPTANTMTIDVTSVNDAPAGADNTVTTLEDTAYTFTAADFGFSDVSDSPANTLLAVTITTLPGAGSLTNNGVAVTAGQSVSLADITAGRLVFTPVADANGAGYASFTFQVQDAGGTANGGVDLDPTPNTITIDVTSANDAPVLVGVNNLASISRNPVSNPGTLLSLLVEGRVTDVDAGALFGVAVTGVDNTNGTWQYSTNGGSSWTAFGSPSDAVARLLTTNTSTYVRFVPNVNWSGTVTNGLTLRAWDQTTGTAGSTANTVPNGGTTAFSAATASTSINVTASNAAPVLSGTNNLTTILEEASPNNGTLVSALIAGHVTDSDPGAQAGIAVTAVDNTNGTWEYSLNSGSTWTAFGTPSTSVARLLASDASTFVRFVPNADWNGSVPAGITFRAWDRTSGVAGSTANVFVTETVRDQFSSVSYNNDDGSASWSTGWVETEKFGGNTPGGGNVRVTGGEVQLKPDTNPSSITRQANLSGATSATFSFDYNNTLGAGDQFVAQVSSNGGSTWTTLPGAVFDSSTNTGAGTKTIDISSYISSNTAIRFAQTADGAKNFIYFDNVEISYSTPGGGTSAFSAASASAGVTVLPVNDAPIRTAGSVNNLTVLEDSGLTSLGLGAVGFGPGGGADEAAQTLSYTVTAVPAAALGDVVLADGTTVVTPGAYSLAQIRGMQFRTAANANGGPATFSFNVQDSGGTANGGVDSRTESLTITVTSVNDAPTGADNTVTTLEDTAYTFTAADFGFSDVSDSPANTMLAVTITTLPGAGSLTNNGVAVTAGQSITLADITAGRLVFTPVANANGVGYASFTFQVQDTGGNGNGGVDLDPTANTMTIDVTSVNDAPAGADKTVTTLEDAAYTFTAADFGFSDVSDSPANTLLAVTITTLPGAGSLTNNGVAVTAGQSITLADITAGRLVFTPAANANGAGYASFTFQVQDTGGTANGGVDLDPTANTMTIDVTSVNDAPAGADKTVVMLESAAYTFAAADFGFTDPSDSPADTLLAVTITTLPGAGSLTNNGVAVTAGQSITLADIIAGRLVFTPVPGVNGAGYASFTFQVQDTGGTANGGADLDPTPNTITIDVTTLNDAPAGADKTITTLEDTGYTFTAADFGFSDPSDSPPNSLLAVRVTTLPAAGSLTNNGVAVTAGQFVSAVDITAGRLVFTPAANANGTGYASFTFQVQDDGGTVGGGVDLDPTANTITVDVTPVNDAPAGANNTVTTLEDTAYTFTAADFGFSDVSDSPANTLLAVTITTLPGAGSLTNNGVAVTAGQSISLADITAGRLVFAPAANANGAGYASFTFQVQDTGGTANGGVDLDPTANTMTIDVTSVNDAPAGADKTVTTLEDTAYTFTAADFGFSDVSDSPANTLLAVTVTTLPGAGSLTNNGVAVTAGQSISLADITAGRLVFTPVANANGAGYASFTFQVQDTGGTANGGVDLDPTANTITVDVTPVNDAPAGANNTVTTLEDTAYTFTAADFGFSDVSDSPANTLLAVTVTTLPGAGSLTNNGVAVTAGQSISLADITAGRLVFTPALNANGAGYASFTFQVQDTGGTANGGVDLDPTANTMTIDVTSVNDAPAGADNTVTTLEDTAYTFTAADFGFSDVSDSPANTLLAVTITTLPGAGSLTNNGVAVTAGQSISLADITAGRLVFTPVANANGVGYASFAFQVQDTGGTANGGVDLDPTANTMTIDVTSVNDAPAGADNTVTTLEDTAYTFTAADFGFSDVSDSPANTLLAVTITTVPGAGSLTNNGVAVTAGQSISLADITAGRLVFTPALNANGAGYASFTFQVQDDGGTANGGGDLDPTANTMTIDVTSVNDAPAGADNTVTTLEDTAYTFTAADFGFSDVSDSPANTLLAVTITTVPGAGSLTNNGVAVTAGQSISLADITAGRLVFTPVANANGAGHASFTFQVQDTGGTANGGMDLDPTPNTMAIDVTSVNDAPAGADNTVTTLEDTAYTFTAADFGFSDVSDSPANTLLAVTITALPGAGSLTNNGVAVTASQSISLADITAGRLVFTPTANANGAGYASFTFQVQDTGGTANGGVDLDPTANTMTIDVTSVNDAPAGADNTVTTLEDTGYTFTAADFGFSDVSDSPANTLLAVTITTLPGAGSLTNNGVAVTAGQSITLADITAGRLVFTPALNVNGAGYASFTFQVQDTGGTTNGGVDLDPTANTMTVDVTSVNDAPAGADKTVATLEDTTYTFTAADFGFSDASDSPANTLLAVTITTLPGAGSLTNNGVAVTAGQSITLADITAGRLVFTPAADANGAGYASFTFQVQDTGGTANGGVDLDPTANTMTVDVTSVNDAPAGADNTVTTLEDTAYTFTAADFGFSDVSDSPANTLLAVTITTLPGAGSLTNNGVAVTAGQSVSLADITAGRLVFTPVANVNGAGYASFTFQVQDDGGTAGGGVDLDPTANTMTVDVTSVNDAPAGADNTVTTLEDTAYTFTAADFGFSDVSDSPANTLLAVTITTVPGAGSLTNNGVAVTAGQSISLADITAGRLVFTPALNANGAGYASFTFQVQDTGGTANGGVDLDPTANTMTIDVTSVNDAPAGADNTVTTLEDTAYTFTAADFGFSDVSDSPANTLLAVTITTPPGAGSLTNNGVAVTAGQSITLADITAGRLVFTPALNANGAGYASFTFQVQDTGGTANGGVDLDPTANTMTIDVTSVNDAPAGADNTVTTLEDTAYTFTAADFGFSDVSDSPANTLLAVTITALPGAGSLTNNGVAVTAGQSISLADITAGRLVFTPALNANGAGYASFTFQVQDTGGTANGGVDLDPTANTMTIDVTSVNDAPAGADNTVTTLEDTAYTFTAADFGFSDVSDSPANTLLAVTITTLPGAGSLTNNGVAVTAGQSISLADITAGRLVFTPAANANGAGYASFTFQVQDTGGTANGGVDLDPTANTMTIDVTSVNDAPAGADNTVTTLEDTAYTFTAADFGFSDVSDSPANTLLAVTITTLPGAGSLTNNGVAVTAGQSITLADITAGRLVFTPVANANGAGYASFTFQVQDTGGTANGGVDLDPTANTMAIDVTSVNDAPAGADNTVTTLEDTAYTFTAADFGFSDVSDSPANTLLAVTITTLPGAGSLTNNGVAVTAGQSITLADITAGRLVFTPVANANGAGYASFTFQLQDTGGTANGGVDLDPTPNTMTIDVTSVNDAPAGADNTVTTLEDTAYTFTAADFGFSDVSDSPANTLLAVTITTLPGAGSLTNNGVAVTAGQSITLADITAGRLVFTPVANANGAGYASFTFQVQDTGGTANGGVDLDPTANTMTIDVTSVNDAPAGTDKTVTTLEDTGYTFTAADFGFSDVSDSPANTLLAVTITTLPGTGSLTNNGVAVTAGQSISLADITAGRLVFTPALNANGVGYASFTFQVQDTGGTANGGVDLDPTANTMTIDVTSVNDAPAGADNTVTTLEDTAYTFTAADFGFSDVSDSPANTLLAVTITTVPGAGSLTNNGVAVTAGQSITLADITAGRLVFTPVANANGAGYASFTFQVQDTGGTANGGVDLDPTPNTMTIDVTAVNDGPVNTVPGLQATSENNPIVFSSAGGNAIAVSDLDAASLQVTLTATNGTLTLASTLGLAFSVGTGTGDATMTFTGTVASINTALDGLSYVPTLNYNGAASLTITTNDLGATGLGGPLSDTDVVAITISAVNTAPVNTVPGLQVGSEDTVLVFSSAGGNAISISDVDAGSSPVQVTLSTGNGRLSLAGTAGLTFTTGTGTGDATMTFTGTMANINAALDGLRFLPSANYNGPAGISITTNDLGNSGAGGPLSVTNVAAISLSPVNDAPAYTLPNVQGTRAETELVFSSARGNAITVSDIDAGANPVQVTLTATNGRLALGTASGLTFLAGSASGAATMTFTGTVAAVNAALDGLRFAPDAGFDGPARLDVTVNDLGNTGAGPAYEANGGITIVVAAADPDPTLFDLPPITPPPPGPDGGPPKPGPTPDPILLDGPSGGIEPPRVDLGRGELEQRFELQLRLPEAASLSSLRPVAEGEDDDRRDDPFDSWTFRFDASIPFGDIPELSATLDALRAELRDRFNDEMRQANVFLSTTEGVALVFSASILAALLRSGSLAALVLSSLPLWRGFDPLVVLTLTDEERKKREEELRHAREDEDQASVGVGDLLDRR